MALGDWKRFYTGKPTGTNWVPIVNANATISRQLKQLVLTNGSGANASISISHLPSGQSTVELPNNVIISSLTLEPGQVEIISFACFVVEPNDLIYAKQTISGAITVHAHGVEGV